MNASREDRRPPTNGLWPRVRSSLTSARNRFLSAGTASPSGGDGSGDEEPAGASDGDAGDGPDRPVRSTERILTPEEEVVQVVSANGGGMRQAEIVSSLDWSESTVSRKLSDMESSDVVTRYQIGREKLVYLPGAEPEGLESPLAHAE